VSYLFQHAITQELVYDSLLAAKRKEHHLAIAEAMERLYADRPDQIAEHAALLALHFTRGGDAERAYRYHHLAGDRAAASYANREAMTHYQEAWRLIPPDKSDPKSAERRLDTAIRLAEVMEPLGEFEATLTLLQDVLNRGQDTADPARYARVHYWMGNNFGNMGRYDEARTHLHRSLELAQQTGDKEAEGYARNYLCQLDSVQGYLKRALEHAEASIACLREAGNTGRMAWAMIFKAGILMGLDREERYRGTLEETREWVERSRNDRSRCLLQFQILWALLDRGKYEENRKAALEALELAEGIGEAILIVFGLESVGLGALHTGKPDLALDFLRKGEAEGQRWGTDWASLASSWPWRKRCCGWARPKRRRGRRKRRLISVRGWTREGRSRGLSTLTPRSSQAFSHGMARGSTR